MKKIYDWVYSLPLSNKLKKEEGKEGGVQDIIARVATDDDSWFFRNGLDDEIISAEKSGEKCVSKKTKILVCVYIIFQI